MERGLLQVGRSTVDRYSSILRGLLIILGNRGSGNHYFRRIREFSQASRTMATKNATNYGDQEDFCRWGSKCINVTMFYGQGLQGDVAMIHWGPT